MVKNLLRDVEDSNSFLTAPGRVLEWRENGRFFRLTCKEHSARRFFFVLALNSDGRRHTLYIPEGKGLLNVWFLLAEKLSCLGVRLAQKESLKGENSSHKGKKGTN